MTAVPWTDYMMDWIISGQLNWALYLNRNLNKDRYRHVVRNILKEIVHAKRGRLLDDVLRSQRHLIILVFGAHAHSVSKSTLLQLLQWDCYAAVNGSLSYSYN